MNHPKTVIHVTHEAAGKIGGIGSVLEGLISAPAYRKGVERTIIIGPMFERKCSPTERLGPEGKILYSSLDGIVGRQYSTSLSKVEHKFGVSIVYGKKRFGGHQGQMTGTAEVILIDVKRANIHPVNGLKSWLYEEYGLASSLYEKDWFFEQYMRLAPAALAALRAVNAADPHEPSLLIAHEHMGVPTALAAMVEPLQTHKTAFYAHETASVRQIVEKHPGHDTMFYTALDWAENNNMFIEDMFGLQDHNFKHALVRAAARCDTILAVSDRVAQELKRLDPVFLNTDIEVVYNGIPDKPVSLDEKFAARERMRQYAENLLDFRPHHIFTHVCRIARSKALWRDLSVLHHIDHQFNREGRSGVFFLLGTDMPQRPGVVIEKMESEWNWPVEHQTKVPDLSHAEEEIYNLTRFFNDSHSNIKVVFVNQFGWSQELCGPRMPADMKPDDIHIGTDAELGLSIYEPFGISVLEPLRAGGLCLVSDVSGCLDLLHEVTDNFEPNVIVANYSHLAGDIGNDLAAIQGIDQARRDGLEAHVSYHAAQKLLDHLPRSEAQMQQLINSGAKLAHEISWEKVTEQYILPGIDSASSHQRKLRIA